MTDQNDDNPNGKPPASPPQADEPEQSGSPDQISVVGPDMELPDAEAQRDAIPEVLPVLPIRGVVGFPGTLMPLDVGRPSSRRLLDESLARSKFVALVTQRDEDDEEPSPEGLFSVGIVAMVLKLLRQPDETVKIIVHGLGRIRIGPYVEHKPFFVAKVKRYELAHPKPSVRRSRAATE